MSYTTLRLTANEPATAYLDWHTPHGRPPLVRITNSNGAAGLRYTLAATDDPTTGSSVPATIDGTISVPAHLDADGRQVVRLVATADATVALQLSST